MNTIKCFHIPQFTRDCILHMPAESKWMNTQIIDGIITMFFCVPFGQESIPRHFRCVGTGESVEPYSLYCGTVEYLRSHLHVIEVTA